jgi:hypothetical protein
MPFIFKPHGTPQSHKFEVSEFWMTQNSIESPNLLFEVFRADKVM